MAKVTVEIDADVVQFLSAIQKAVKGTDNFSDSIGNIGKSSTLSFAVLATGINQGIELFNKLESALQAPIEAFHEQEKASNKLALALENQGLNVADLSKKYRDIAASLQVKTGVDDDAIVSNLALLQSFIGQQEITPALAKTLVDLAERTGNMEVAAETLGRAINGDTRLLKPFNVEIDKAGTNADRTAQLVDKFGVKVGGAAEAANKGLGGVRGLKSAFSDLLELVGEQFSPVIEVLINGLKDLISLLTKSPEVKIFSHDFANLLAFILDKVLKLINGFVRLTLAGADAANTLKNSVAGFLGIKTTPTPGVGSAPSAAETPSTGSSAAQVQAKAEAAAIEQDKKDRRDQAAQENRAGLEEQLATNAEFQALDEDQQAQFLEANHAKLEEAFHTAQESQDAALNTSLTTQINAHNKFLTEQQKYGDAYAQINKVIYSEQVVGAAKSFGELANLQKSNNAVLKSIGKAAAVADITYKTAQSAMSIFAGFQALPFGIGVALGIAGAAAAVAFGGEQIANVLSAQQGGIVPGINRGVDSVPSLLQPGELVVPRTNFAEVVNAVASGRTQSNSSSSSGSPENLSGGASSEIVTRLEFSGDNAEKFLTARQVESRSLGTLRESA